MNKRRSPGALERRKVGRTANESVAGCSCSTAPLLHGAFSPALRLFSAILLFGAGLLLPSPRLDGAISPAPPTQLGGKSTNLAPATARPNFPATLPPVAAPRPNLRTNPAPAALRPGVRTNAAVVAPRLGARTNAAVVPPRAGAKTNAPAAAQPTAAKAGSSLADSFRRLQAQQAFYPIVAGVIVALGATLVILFKRKSSPADKTPVVDLPSTRPASGQTRGKAARTGIHSCNVLQVGPDARRLWQFDARGGSFVLNRQQTSLAGEPLPASLIAKSWSALFQRKLNVAWLPPEHVFLRVAQFPVSDFNETLAMVELQLEKLSPMPVAQVVWTIQVLPQAQGKMQTVIVMIAARNAVEEFLGQLEGQGYLADSLELPLLDQLQATAITGDGAWIYPEAAGGKNMALVAWWYGGVLRNLDFITLPAANRPASFKEQLLQMAWAGELEGWLSSAPRWHMVAEAETAAEWESALREGLEQPVEVLAPLAAPQLAALTARRTAQVESGANLLPTEFSTRYQQQFVDRLWVRGLLTVGALYIVGLAIYGVALGFLTFSTNRVEQQVTDLTPEYNKAIELRDRLGVLRDRQELKFAALECWNLIARNLPEGLTLDSMNFTDGKKLTLTGTVPDDQIPQVNDFEVAMRKEIVNNQPFFDPLGGEHFTCQRASPGTMRWSFILELKRSEVL